METVFVELCVEGVVAADDELGRASTEDLFFELVQFHHDAGELVFFMLGTFFDELQVADPMP